MTQTPDIKREGFDFDRWRALAEAGETSFEAARQAAIRQFLDDIEDPELRRRMERLQWRVEQERARSDNPMGACIRIYNMMWRSVSDNYELLTRLVAGDGQLTPAPARVIPFPRATGTDA